jgi:ribonucleotide reductase beta subunit family protein with ferritin-like domain
MNNPPRFMLSVVTMNEAKIYYAQQMAQESVHVVVHAQMITNIGLSDEANRIIRNCHKTSHVIRLKQKWLRDVLGLGADQEITRDLFEKDTTLFGKCLFINICMELIHFSSTFAHFDYLKAIGVCIGLTVANDYISLDEYMHGMAGIEFFKMLQPRHRPHPIWCRDTLASAVRLEQIYVCDQYRGSKGDKYLHPANLFAHVETIANMIWREVGFPDSVKIYPSVDETPLMPIVKHGSSKSRTNPYEMRSLEYGNLVSQ